KVIRKRNCMPRGCRCHRSKISCSL
ncbi:chorismate synthase family protein, partial [Chlamydia psittaci 84-8471/1]